MITDTSKPSRLRPALAAALLTITVASCSSAPDDTADATASRQAEIAAKGRAVMPFDLDRTTHRFTKSSDGGVQTVVADEPDETTQVRLIRGHLAEEAARFSRGDFSDPTRIHGPEMPGLAELSRAPTRIQIEYDDVAAGARITYSTYDRELVGALHRWFDAQVSDHGRHAGHG